MYDNVILDHFQFPHNKHSLAEANYASEHLNPSCGDSIQLFARVENGLIQEISFTGKGCAISTAAASMLTDSLKGKKLQTLQKLTKEKIVDMLGIELSPNRLKCALLPLEAVQHLQKVTK